MTADSELNFTNPEHDSMPRLARFRLAVSILCASFALTAAAHAQVVAGRVVDERTRLPVGNSTVRLFDEQGRRADSTSADSAGFFSARVAVAGIYRVWISVATSVAFESPPIAIAPGDTTHLQFEVISAPYYYEFQVDKQVSARPDAVGLTYPKELRDNNVEGEVLAQFIVDTNGVVRPGSFRIIRSSNGLFSSAVREAIYRIRYFPAERHGEKVAQAVLQPFTFGLGR